MVNTDKTYCASPNCKNACGRQMSAEDKKALINLELADFGIPVRYGFFCDDEVECKHEWEKSSFLYNVCKLCGVLLR